MGSAERNSLLNRAWKNFATGPRTDGRMERPPLERKIAPQRTRTASSAGRVNESLTIPRHALGPAEPSRVVARTRRSRIRGAVLIILNPLTGQLVTIDFLNRAR